MILRLVLLLAAILLPTAAQAQSTVLENYVFSGAAGAASTPLASTVKCPVFPNSTASSLQTVLCQNLMGKQPGTYNAGHALVVGAGAMSSTDATDAGGAPGLTNATQNWQNDQAVQYQTLTAGATVTPTGSFKGWQLTPNQNTTIYPPSGNLCGSTASYTCGKFFKIIQPNSGSTTYGVTFCQGNPCNTGSTYYFPAGGAQPVTTNATGVADYISCQVYASTGEMDCSNNGLSNFQEAAIVTLDSNHNSPTNTGGGVTSATANITGNTAGHWGIVVPYACVNSGCTGATGTAPTSVTSSAGGTCTALANAFNTGSVSGVEGGPWLCPNIPAGSTTITANWGSTVYYAGVFWAGFSGPPWLTQADASLGNVSSGTSASSGSIQTSGSTSLNGQPIVGWCNGGGAPVITSPATLIAKDNSTDNVLFWLNSPVTQQQTVAFTQTAAAYGCAVGAIK